MSKAKAIEKEFEARINKLMVRIFRLEVRTANERKRLRNNGVEEEPNTGFYPG